MCVSALLNEITEIELFLFYSLFIKKFLATFYANVGGAIAQSNRHLLADDSYPEGEIMARKATTARKNTTKVDKEQVQKYYRDMLLIRRFEEKAGQIYGMGLIGGFCHLYIGQEAVVVGM